MSQPVAPMFIDGKEHTPDRPTRVLRSPGDGTECGAIRLGTTEDVDLAVRAARAAAPGLRTTPVFERADLCRRLADAVAANRTDLARRLSTEHGKPFHTEAHGEIDAVVNAFRDAADQVVSMRTESIAVRDPAKRVAVTRRPRGVYAVVTPWNFPLAVASIYYLAPGLATGNALVWTPAPSVAGVAAELTAILHDAGLPAGALNLVTGEGPVVGNAAIRHPGVDAVAFTGSTATGHRIAEAAVGKPLQLELGGNGPTIVLPDADLDLAARAIAGGCFANAGQICTSTERILAHRDIATPLAERIAEHAAAVVLGDPFDPATTMGPVHTADLAAKVRGQVEAAVAGGGRLVAGGTALPDAPTPNYVPATVVDGVPHDAELHVAETFGPVAPVVHFADDAELRSLVHRSDFGLSGAVFSADIERAIPLAESLPCGIVNLNEASSYWEPNIPAGGVSGTGSGYGRTGGPWSLEEMTEQQAIVITTRSGD
ncbi:succinate-semialdehyde dehydrogenase/glutarate-semialdehyde dehydrogenase [Murinocardiopsis flavida]|uniref:Succinate-semialdehyde dehydrogenase/glutarate-semialdehyde dehydrogenase n=1 Tax=Murinocardiopsis flavida TaxID=645275 RepID=A0A2P8CXJ1_9ACTN|nr:aldehyde dehydrogenase family protein [Murinocardiopsis flavida]PSK89692.1 succinate-semialdehyde dehydrogenase/glutarate-semialdehyde dehydrogenase [Murinocardiopsis flavida]